MGATISAYFNREGTYVAIFKFPEVKPYREAASSTTDEYVSNILGSQVATLINNAVARLQPKRVILAGLTDAQKTFCGFIPENRKVEIRNIDEIDSKLRFLKSKFRGTLICSEENLLVGLSDAKRSKTKLRVEKELSYSPTNAKRSQASGVVVIEAEDDISSIIAINYAFAINADVVFVKPLSRREAYEVKRDLYRWKQPDATAQREEVNQIIKDRLHGVDFEPYKFATFFTEGLPYGLFLKNRLPISYVRRSMKEDFFIFDNILYENLDSFEAAVVFSPEEFDEEETTDVINSLSKSGFLVKPLLNQTATVRNFGYYAEHYPYDILHICSHGGEIDGYRVTEHFTDRAAKDHTVEYDEVVGFDHVPDEKMVHVTRKVIFRRLDGFVWMSPELKAYNLPQYVFEDMRKALFDGRLTKQSATRKRVKEPIASSCHVKCYDGIHQGMFWAVASHSSPFIFNNTCSSWDDISLFFISGGSRGYIGTLWSINNSTAKAAAEHFYKSLFGRPILDSVFSTITSIGQSSDADIYAYWGLHFSTLQKPAQNGIRKVPRELAKAAMRWCQKIMTTKISEVKENSARNLEFVLSELYTSSDQDCISKVQNIISKSPQIKEALAMKKRTLEWTDRGFLPLEVR